MRAAGEKNGGIRGVNDRKNHSGCPPQAFFFLDLGLIPTDFFLPRMLIPPNPKFQFPAKANSHIFSKNLSSPRR